MNQDVTGIEKKETGIGEELVGGDCRQVSGAGASPW